MTTSLRTALAALLACSCLVVSASAQAPSPGARPGGRPAVQAFAIEAAGGIVGSTLGFSTAYLAERDCDAEDLSCILRTASLAVVASTAGAALGTWATGRAFDTQPSGIGATVGAIAGAAAGVGMYHLLTEELNVVGGRVPVMLSYTVTQGVVAALGSRVARSLR
jgi:hypothetical protein